MHFIGKNWLQQNLTYDLWEWEWEWEWKGEWEWEWEWE